MLAEFAAWLGATGLSQALQNALWVVPMVQALHILAIAAVMASAWLLSFRLMGVAGQTQTVAQVSGRLGPWIWRALIVLLATGVILIIGEPARQLTSAVFGAKMLLLAGAVTLTAGFQFALIRNAARWDRVSGTPLAAKFLGLILLALWVSIAVAGRWIAYAEHG